MKFYWVIPIIGLIFLRKLAEWVCVENITYYQYLSRGLIANWIAFINAIALCIIMFYIFFK
jgi:hypothetical protein